MSEIVDFRELPLGPYGDSLIVECPSCGEHAYFGPVVEEIYRKYIHLVVDGKVEADCDVREYI
jgi:hypothetical protein